MNQFILPVPREFRYEFSLQFLKRSPKEILHRVESEQVTKLLRIDGVPVLFRVEAHAEGLQVSFLNGIPGEKAIDSIKEFVSEWFDLQTNLDTFYKMARKDVMLKPLVSKYRGQRIMSHPDLFESLSWAVLGQQINLAFAYSLKQRFVEQFGEIIEFEGLKYYLFPTAEVVSQIKPEQLYPLQFSRQKASYIIGIARAFASGELSKEKLRGLSLQQAKEELIRIKGIGNWTANYALMRTFRYPDAFPLEDVALHKAIMIQMGLRKKPSLSRVKKIFKAYKGWEAYATIYLWRSL